MTYLVCCEKYGKKHLQGSVKYSKYLTEKNPPSSLQHYSSETRALPDYIGTLC